MTWSKIPLILISLFALSACNFRDAKQASANAAVNSEDLNEICFDDVQVMFRNTCVPCHARMATYAGIVGQIGLIQQKVFIDKTMPKAPMAPLTDTELSTLATWIAAGAPEFPAVTPTPAPQAPLTATYASIQANILDKKCVFCHSPSGEASDITLQSLSDLLLPGFDIVVPGKPDDSLLFSLVQETAVRRMPPRSSNVTPVTAEESAAIRTWIQNGAKD